MTFGMRCRAGIARTARATAPACMLALMLCLTGLPSGGDGLSLGQAAQAASDKVAVVSRVVGKVERLSAGQRIAVHVGDPIHGTDHLLTGADGRARLQFSDGSAVVVGPASDLEIASYDMDQASQPGALLRLAEGIVRAIVDTMPSNGRFAIASPTAVAAVRGTAFIVQAEKQTTGVFVIDGVVFVKSAQTEDGAVSVQNGQGTDVPQDGKPSAPASWATERVQQIFALTQMP